MSVLPLEPLPCGAAEFDDEGKVHYANATLAGWLGTDVETLVGGSFDALLPIANRIFFQTHFFPLLRLHGHAEEIFLNLLTSDGDRVPVIISALRHETLAGPRNQCIFVTVRQRRKYEDEILQAKEVAETALRNNDELRAARHALELRAQELERTVRQVQSRNDDLQRVTQVLSHDLREPIRKIGLFADLVRSELAPEPETEAAVALRKIDTEAAQMDSLLTAMRQFLQPDDHGPIELLDLKQMIETVTAAVSLKLKFTDWVMDCPALPEVEGRRTQLYRVFVHLLENAVKFRNNSRRLRVIITGRTVQQNAFAAIKDRYHYIDCAQIEVEDNGTGFDPKYREYAFQLLKKVDLQSPGLGVGLAVCRKIIASHYGSIQADSQAGVGTKVTIVLPLAQPVRER